MRKLKVGCDVWIYYKDAWTQFPIVSESRLSWQVLLFAHTPYVNIPKSTQSDALVVVVNQVSRSGPGTWVPCALTESARDEALALHKIYMETVG